jgi:hypothetical protein
MDEILLQLFERLELVGDQHEELYDSEVREALDRAVGDGFLMPDATFVLPTEFGMYSAEANRLVCDALASFLVSARAIVASGNLQTFHQRLSAFQNENLYTARRSDYNSFFGWANPKDYDESGLARPR